MTSQENPTFIEKSNESTKFMVDPLHFYTSSDKSLTKIQSVNHIQAVQLNRRLYNLLFSILYCHSQISEQGETVSSTTAASTVSVVTGVPSTVQASNVIPNTVLQRFHNFLFFMNSPPL